VDGLAERTALLAGLGVPAGLCAGCEFALLNRTRRGTVYLRCGLAAEDPRFPRYPPLPVLRCRGFAPLPAS
jgi:hypothetical protein